MIGLGKMKCGDCRSLREHSKVSKEVVGSRQIPPWSYGEGMAGKGPEWGPLKNGFLNGGPSGRGPGAGLAESRGCACDILGAPSAIPMRISRNGRWLAGLGCLGSPLCGLGLILSPVRSLLPIKYAFPLSVAINSSKNTKKLWFIWFLILPSSPSSFCIKYFNRYACLASTF